jgi:outer membrane protein assembly factor BamB
VFLADGGDPIALADHDPDILWRFDIPADAGIHPHDSAHSSILIDGPLLYLNSGNGVDNTHRKIRCPDGPSLIVLDKATGRLVAQDNEGIGPRIFHCTWSPPSLGEVHGRRMVVFGGADGVCYAFTPLPHDARPTTPMALTRIWRFDCDPTAPKENVHQYVGNRQQSPSMISGMPVLHEDRVYVAAGGDIWWGKREASLYCIDASGKGDITETGRLWTAKLNRHCSSTPAVYDGLVFIADCGGVVHCLEAASGKTLWAHQAGGDMWGSTLVADGKVYVGTRRKRLWILKAARQLEVLCEAKLDSAVQGTPTAAPDGTLYVATMRRLYAFGR